jgi:hypothetical protein
MAGATALADGVAADAVVGVARTFDSMRLPGAVALVAGATVAVAAAGSAATADAFVGAATAEADDGSAVAAEADDAVTVPTGAATGAGASDGSGL